MKIRKEQEFRKDGKADQMPLEDKDQDYNGQLSDESFATIDTSGIVYTSKNNQMQEPKTEDNALQRKQKLAKARRICFCSTDDRNKKTELARRTPEQEGTPPDFSKTMDRESDSLDRRIGRLRGQGFIIDPQSVEKTSFTMNDTTERKYSAEDRLSSGNEFAGVRRKNLTFENTEAHRQQIVASKSSDSLQGRQISEDILRKNICSDKEADFDYVRGANKHLSFDSDESRDYELRSRDYSEVERKGRRESDRISYGHPRYDVSNEMNTNSSRQLSMENFESQLMTKILKELRIQNQQLYAAAYETASEEAKKSAGRQKEYYDERVR